MPALRSFASRRRFLKLLNDITWSAGGIAIGIAAAPRGSLAEVTRANGAPGKTLLENSPFVYISPLLADGKESACHAELWFGWIDESVVVIVDPERWKAKALDRGFDRARVWVGDHGLWKGWFGSRNEAFREAPHFDAQVERIDDAKTIDTLLAIYEKKYPEEIADWRDVMRKGAADGSRVLLRYRAKA